MNKDQLSAAQKSVPFSWGFSHADRYILGGILPSFLRLCLSSAAAVVWKRNRVTTVGVMITPTRRVTITIRPVKRQRRLGGPNEFFL